MTDPIEQAISECFQEVERMTVEEVTELIQVVDLDKGWFNYAKEAYMDLRSAANGLFGFL